VTWLANINDRSTADLAQTDSGHKDADTHRLAVWQQGSLIAIQDNWHWLRSSFS